MAKRFIWLLASVAALLLVSTGLASASLESLHDDSNVLDKGKVTDAANALPDPVQIFTTTKSADNRANFDREAQSHVKNPTDVVIAINTQSHWITIRTGRNSHILNANPATDAFKSAYGPNQDYTGGTVAALNSLASIAKQPAPANQQHRPAPPPQARHSTQHSGFSLVGLLCPLVIIALIVAAVVAVIRRRRGGGGGGMFNRGNPPGGVGPGANYGPGGGYGPGYDPGYAPRQGMSPGMAGGLGAVGGAVGGGLLGYELGKMEGREEERGHEYGQGFSGGYEQQAPQEWGGGGSDGDFGGGGDSGGGFDGGGGGNGDF
ncbi:hypothetical protein [Nocardia terpenica]|uniref:TPM domain-containing protein n=1 Tax=Nocardia terpenica TaxID=455432 RepID=A0A161WRD3_9NOCA|nr:hypothetical protein [Nocardia terpenica]KZM75915.1 hypothetical protein AWN90_16410 [Nocardia terpenica]